MASTNNLVPGGSQFFTDSTTWCVTVTNTKGDKAAAGVKYSAANGLVTGAPCAAATG